MFRTPREVHPTLLRLHLLVVMLVVFPAMLFLAHMVFDIGQDQAAYRARYLEEGVRATALVTGMKRHHWRDAQQREQSTVMVQVRFQHQGQMLEASLPGLKNLLHHLGNGKAVSDVEVIHLPSQPKAIIWAADLATMPTGWSMRLGGLSLVVLSLLVAWMCWQTMPRGKSRA